MWDLRLAKISTRKHRIELLDNKTTLVQSAPYCAGTKTHGFGATETIKMFEDNVIEPAKTEWASSFDFASKKDETFRFCLDCYKLNALTKNNQHPTPQN